VRRRTGARALSPEELAVVFDGALREHGDDRGAVDVLLAEHGFDAVDAIRSRRWVRLGRPADWHPFALHVRPRAAGRTASQG